MLFKFTDDERRQALAECTVLSLKERIFINEQYMKLSDSDLAKACRCTERIVLLHRSVNHLARKDESCEPLFKKTKAPIKSRKTKRKSTLMEYAVFHGDGVVDNATLAVAYLKAAHHNIKWLHARTRKFAESIRLHPVDILAHYRKYGTLDGLQPAIGSKTLLEVIRIGAEAYIEKRDKHNSAAQESHD